MNNSLNLASKPFSNRIVPWVLTAMILFVSLIGLIVVVRLTTNARREAEVTEAKTNELKRQEQTLLEAAKVVRNSFTADQQLALPAAHALVDRKGFSWSRLLADLETSLPNNIKVSRISVREVNRQANQTVAQLDLSVFTKTPSTLSDWINQLQQGGIFEAVLLNQQLQKGRGEVGTEYDLLVVYRARPGFASESVAEANPQRNGGEAQR